MMRFLIDILIAGALAGAVAGVAARPPNIIFILADDMGYGDLGCYGNPYNETPHLDRLAENGLRFTQAYAAPACSPSRAALMTGLEPARLKITTALGLNRTDPASPVEPPRVARYLPGEAVTLAEKLEEAGYRTGMVGKWHLGEAPGTRPWDQGFSFVRTITKNELNYYHYEISGREGVVHADKGDSYLTDRLTDYALEFLAAKDDQPFFLYLAYTAPHVYIIPKAQNLEKYLRKYNTFEGKYNPYYASMIDNLDENVGRLLKGLEDSGRGRDTLVVFMSDNGGVGMDQMGPTPTNMQPLRAWKGHVYEGGVRVPLMVSWAGHIREGRTEDGPVIIQDWFPTLLDVAGGGADGAERDGRSFAPVLLGEDHGFDRGPIYWHFPHFTGQGGRPAGALRCGRWKLVENLETNACELYDLENDQAETHNLIDVYPQRVQEMWDRLQAWRKKVQADMPAPKS